MLAAFFMAASCDTANSVEPNNKVTSEKFSIEFFLPERFTLLRVDTQYFGGTFNYCNLFAQKVDTNYQIRIYYSLTSLYVPDGRDLSLDRIMERENEQLFSMSNRTDGKAELVEINGDQYIHGHYSLSISRFILDKLITVKNKEFIQLDLRKYNYQESDSADFIALRDSLFSSIKIEPIK